MSEILLFVNIVFVIFHFGNLSVSEYLSFQDVLETFYKGAQVPGLLLKGTLTCVLPSLEVAQDLALNPFERFSKASLGPRESGLWRRP